MPTLRKTFESNIVGWALPTFDRREFRVDRALGQTVPLNREDPKKHPLSFPIFSSQPPILTEAQTQFALLNGT